MSTTTAHMALVAQLRRRHRRGRALRPHRATTRPRSRSPCTTTSRAAGSARCCSSTSPSSRARRASRRSPPTRLPDNARMLNVFADAGWVASVASPTAPCASRSRSSRRPTRSRRSRRESSIRRRRRSARLLAPRSIAVIGASRDAGTIGHELFRNLLAYGFEGPVYPVNPTARCRSRACGVPERPRRARRGRPRGRRRPGGRGARGRRGVRAKRRARARRHLRRLRRSRRRRAAGANERSSRPRAGNGMRIIGPNCLGIVNTAPDVRMNATFAPVTPVRGQVAFLSQSGGLGIELIEPGRRARHRHLGVRVGRQQGRRRAATTSCSTGRTTRTPT